MKKRDIWLFVSLRNYRPSWLTSDAIAALTLAAIAIPEQLATARLIGMPPMAGLLAFAAGTFAFAAFGANRFMSVGADSTIAPIMASALAVTAAAGTAQYAGMAAALAILVGAALLLAGLLIVWFTPNTQQIMGKGAEILARPFSWLRWYPSWRWTLAAAVLFLTTILLFTQNSTFLYFQF